MITSRERPLGKLLRFFVLAASLSSTQDLIHCTPNYVYLRIVQEGFAKRIFNDIQDDAASVRRSLGFLESEYDVDRHCIRPGSFEAFYKDAKERLETRKPSEFEGKSALLHFYDTCRDVFHESESKGDKVAQAAVYLLMEGVEKEVLDSIAALEKYEEILKRRALSRSATAQKSVLKGSVA